MSDGGHHEALTAAAWFAPAVALASSLMTGVLLFLAQRLVGKAAWQAAVTAANKDLIDQLQEERRDMLAERAAERSGWVAERSRMEGEILDLRQQVESFNAYMRRSGMDPIDFRRPASEVIVLEGTSK